MAGDRGARQRDPPRSSGVPWLGLEVGRGAGAGVGCETGVGVLGWAGGVSAEVG